MEKPVHDGLTDEQQLFIEDFKEQARDRPAIKEDRVANLGGIKTAFRFAFNSIIVLLLLAPIVISSVFLSTMSQYQRIVGDKGEAVLGERITPDELKEIAEQLGYTDFDSIITLYQNRYQIVIGIFVGFAFVIVLMFLLRLLVGLVVSNRRKNAK